MQAQEERPSDAAPDSSRAAEIRTALDRLLQSPEFRIPNRRARLLRYLVEGTLSGKSETVNEYAIGVDVLDKTEGFDPKTDASVRAEISRLRQNLKEYYGNAGKADEVRIDLPPRGYFPVFFFGPVPVASAPRAAAAAKMFPWRWMAVAMAVLASAAGAGVAWRSRSAGKGRISSIVVLPFEDHSPNRQSDYLADGLTDEVTNDLANLNDLRVIARTSAFVFKDKGADVRQIGRELNVEAALEGSIVREGDRLHIRVQLNRTLDGYHLWSRSYDTTFNDLISVQRDIARSIADDLQWSRSGADASAFVPRGATTDPQAHELYLRGLAAANAGTADGLGKAIVLMQAALAKDPRYAAPWFMTAKMHETIGYLGGWPPGMAEQVRGDLQHALELDPSMAGAHADLAYLDWVYDYDWPHAEREFELALEQGSRVEPHKFYAMGLADRGRFAESHEHLRMAEDLAPLDAELLFLEGGVLAWEHRFPDAEQKYLAMLKLNPNSTPALAAIAYIKTWENDCAGGAQYLSRMQQLDPNGYRTGSVHFAILACRGDKTGALQLIADGQARKKFLPAIDMAQGYAYLGEKEKAMEALKLAVERHELGVTSMKQSPYFETLHDDPRFMALERRVGLEP